MTKALPEIAQTIIIGGGIVGCSVAYHLAKSGHGNVVLLERKQLTSGSTWHAAGLVSQFHGYPCVTKLASYGIELMQELEAETGQATGFEAVGAIGVALNAARREALLRRKDIAIGQGLEVRSLSLAELEEKWPLLNSEGILEAIYFPNDGRTNPIDTTIALAKGARAAGATIIENTEVLNLIIEKGRVLGVETEKGTIHADNVVNCTGIWGHSFAQNNGTQLPIQHNQHFYVVTDSIADLHKATPVLRVYDEQSYYKEDAGKLLIGFAELNGMPWEPIGGIPKNFEFDEILCPEEHLMPILEKCLARIPALENSGIRTFFNGPEGYTPDGRYYLGEDKNIAGLFVAAGFNSSGIQNGPGAGMALAQWIIKGHAPSDLIDVDVRRVQPYQTSKEYLRKRGPETLSETYAMPWPYKQRSTMRGLRRSPVHEPMKQAGAVFGEAAGWERPMWFDSSSDTKENHYSYNKPSWFENWQAEHNAVRNDLGLLDLSPFAKILVEGSDAESVLQNISSNNLAIAPGRVVYTQWLNERAGIEADLTIARLSETRYLIMTGAANAASDVAWLQKHTPFEARVTMTDISDAQAAFGLSGPRARDFLSAYTEADLSNEAFRFADSQSIDIGAANVRAQRISYTGELGWELYVDSSMAGYLLELLMSGSKAKAPKLVGFRAAESLRCEKAFRHWGHDIGYCDTPLDAGLLFASKLKRDINFIGRQALEKSVLKGSQRALFQFLLDDPDLYIYHNEPIYYDNEIIGSITTGTYSHTFDRPMGLGWVTIPAGMNAQAFAEQKFQVLVCGKKIHAKASASPMYDPSSGRIRS
ncbi:MAG: heterotetrameric sarcosine oxidase gamma subunit [Flavobacterium sp.]